MAKPHPNCRPLFCWETGEPYPSVYAAARAIDVSPPSVRKSVKFGCVAGDFHFYDRSVPRSERPRMRAGKSRWVRCHETRSVFVSMKAAAQWLRDEQGIPWCRRHLMRRVMESCEGGEAVSGRFNFSYVPVKARKLAAFDLHRG